MSEKSEQVIIEILNKDNKIYKAKNTFKELDCTNKSLWVLFFTGPLIYSLYSLSLLMTFAKEVDDISWYICLSIFIYYVVTVCAVMSRFLLGVSHAIIIFLANTLVAIAITVLDHHNVEDNDDQILVVQINIAIGTAVCHYIGVFLALVGLISKGIYNICWRN